MEMRLKPRREHPASLRNCGRCGARTRSGKSCLSPTVKGKSRCRMHGGSKGSGAPSGNRNGNYRHGGATREAIESVRELRAWVKIANEYLAD